jgi:hypothetical protein
MMTVAAWTVIVSPVTTDTTTGGISSVAMTAAAIDDGGE